MKKRRRLADKIAILGCAVLCAVSAFFYAPMEVHAGEVMSFEPIASADASVYSDLMPGVSGSFDSLDRYIWEIPLQTVDIVDLSPYFTQGEGVYKVNCSISANFSSSLSVYWRNVFVCLNVNNHNTNYQTMGNSDTNLNDYNITKDSYTFYIDSTMPNVVIMRTAVLVGFSSSSLDLTSSVSLNNIVCEKLTSSESNEYQSGYNAGYSDGESAGYGSGYSDGFAEGESSVDTDKIYNDAFQAGQGSVNTDSYFDAGYDAGYQVGLQESYDIGYEDGYQNAMNRIDSWGADSVDYPILLTSFGNNDLYRYIMMTNSVPFDYEAFSAYPYLNLDINPNHTYRIDLNINMSDLTFTQALFNYNGNVYFDIGGLRYYVSNFFQNMSVPIDTTFYVSGDRMSDSMSVVYAFENVVQLVSGYTSTASFYTDEVIKIYDCGPSGDTQNHIANQTDKLLNGWDSSHGNSVNDNLSSGLNEYQTAEDSLWATATTGLKDFTFFDFESVPAMITGLSFVTSIMTTWFNNAGGASGVGIVLSVLFSVMLVSMVLGLYRMYQSAGHRAEVQKRRESRKKGK